VSIKQQVNTFTKGSGVGREKKGQSKKRIKEQVLRATQESIKMSQHKKSTLR